MRLIVIIFLVLCTLLVVKTVNSYRILGMFPTTSKSHYYLGHAIFKELAKQGHDVTLISPFQAKNLPPNYKEIFLEESWELSRKSNFCFSSDSILFGEIIELINVFLIFSVRQG